MQRLASGLKSIMANKAKAERRRTDQAMPRSSRPYGKSRPTPPFLWIGAGGRRPGAFQLLGFAFLSFLLTALSCAPPPVSRQDWRPDKGIEELISLSRNPLHSLRDLKARGSVTIHRKEGRERAAMSILLAQPDLLRMEVRGPLYTHLFTALVQADSLTVLSREGNWKGSTQSLLHQLTGMELGPYNLRYLLLGQIEPGRIDSSRSIEHPRAGRAVVPLRGPDLARRVWIDLYRGFFIREEVEPSRGYPGWNRQMQDYRKVGPLYLPRTVVIRQNEVAITLEYEDVAVNEGVEEEHFFGGVIPDSIQRIE